MTIIDFNKYYHQNHITYCGKIVPSEVLTNFLAYWSIRKSEPFVAARTIRNIKIQKPERWFELIESNHKFREIYGEEIAEEVIKIIQHGYKAS